MERHFEQELQKLKKRIVKMGLLVAEQVHQSMVALTECNAEMAQAIIDQDNAVDELDVKIDKLCQRIFALTQPVATDLRLIMAALKMNNDLERMADHAVDIARKIEGLNDYKEIITELKIDEIAARTDVMVHDVINILTTRNTVFVRDIFEEASAIREQAQEMSGRIIEQMMLKTDVIVVATNLVIILTQIERLAGYSTNIAESMVFLVEGKIVKHSRSFKEEIAGEHPTPGPEITTNTQTENPD
jgi:phosphate transport system protein